MGLIASAICLLFNGEPLLLFVVGATFLATCGIGCNTSGGCFVSSHDISRSTYVDTPVPRFSGSRSRKSSSAMYKLAWLPQYDPRGERISRFGQSGVAQLAKEEVLSDEGGVIGKKEQLEEEDETGDTGERLRSEGVVEAEVCDAGEVDKSAHDVVGGDIEALKGLFLDLEKAREGIARREGSLLLSLRHMLSRS